MKDEWQLIEALGAKLKALQYYVSCSPHERASIHSHTVETLLTSTNAAIDALLFCGAVRSPRVTKASALRIVSDCAERAIRGEAMMATDSMFPEMTPADPSHPKWADLERLALYEPAAQCAVTLFQQGAMTEVEALIALAFALYDVKRRHFDAELERLRNQRIGDKERR